MILKIVRYFFGFVKFKIIGEYPERLLNQLALNGISVWGIARSKYGLSACVFTKDYKKIRRLRAKNKVRTRVLRRYGLPVAVKKHRLRVGFVIGLVLYIAVLFFMAGFIWNVRIIGNSSLNEKEILAVCRELGLYEGVSKSSIDAKDFRTQLALKIDNIAWASVNIEGVRATVNISESKPLKNNPPENSNLVASADGVITAVEVTSGTVKIKVGQTVKKGDLLVSGITEYKDGTFKFGASQGEVYAETLRVIEHFVPFYNTETVRNGDVTKKRVLTLFGLNIPLYLGSYKGNYETGTVKRQYKNGGMYLPVSLTETKFYGLYEREYILTETEAKEKALAEVENLIALELKGAEISGKTIEFTVQPDGVSVKATLNCKENIAVEDLLLILQ